MYAITTMCKQVAGVFILHHTDAVIQHLVYDSRKISFAETSLFFALHTGQNNGHHYIKDAYKKGLRNFIVEEEINTAALPGSNVIRVSNTVAALQQVVRFHRQHFDIPVIGITGSNGKTIVKEWLYQLLQEDYAIVRSPKSYNSQIGVPLSVWEMNGGHTLGIFEAGISEVGEMEQLALIIQPTLGLLTTIGEAHDAGFGSHHQKLQEKSKLFGAAEIVIAPERFSPDTIEAALFLWGESDTAALKIVSVEKQVDTTHIRGFYQHQYLSLIIPFTDDASVQNGISCWCVLLYLGYDGETINQRFAQLHAVEMRLKLASGINNCTIINDSYSADEASLKIALHFLAQQQFSENKTVILSDFFGTGLTDEILYSKVAAQLQQHKVQKVILIGERITHHLPLHLSNTELQAFSSTEDFIQQFRSSSFRDETILIKGARRFRFEQIARLFEQKLHQTILEINLAAIAHNLKEYRKVIPPATKVMAMVKAFAYGSGGAEIAGVLQYNNIDYLGVAYADEGIALRKAGITTPVMVMNSDESSFGSIIDYNLQPVIYSPPLLQRFEYYVHKEGLLYYPVHLEVETGMNRLGFSVSDIEATAAHIKDSGLIKIESLFSHLAASEDPAQDDFTKTQVLLFKEAIHLVQKTISYPFLKHISNSAAIIRHPQLGLDMVRLGIGLYGIETVDNNLALQPVATLRSTIAQIKHLKKGETVSYNRRGIAKEDTVIATVRIGYADGYSRRFSNGRGSMWVHGVLAQVIGSVCMDMTMLDVTGIRDVKEGDDVLVFGQQLPVQQVAAWMDTIPYELMTAVSQRVKRIYFQE